MKSAGKTCCPLFYGLLLPLWCMGLTCALADEVRDFDRHMTRFPPVNNGSRSGQRLTSPGLSGETHHRYPRTESPDAPQRGGVPRTGSPDGP